MTRGALVVVLSFLVSMVALAQTQGPPPIRDATPVGVVWVSCVTTAVDGDGTVVAAARAAREQISIQTTAGSGIVYITKAATVASPPSGFHLSGASSWTDDGQVVYSGAYSCSTLTGTVSVGVIDEGP